MGYHSGCFDCMVDYMKKWIISLLIIIALCGIRFYDVWILDVLRLKALDSHQRQQQTEIVDNVVTIETVSYTHLTLPTKRIV